MDQFFINNSSSIVASNVDAFAELLSQHWKLSQMIDAGRYNESGQCELIQKGDDDLSYSIEAFQALNSPEHMVMTQHSRRRFDERGIRIENIIDAISTGEIIEDYCTDTIIIHNILH